MITRPAGAAALALRLALRLSGRVTSNADGDVTVFRRRRDSTAGGIAS